MKKVLFCFIILATVSACASIYTSAIKGNEADRKNALIMIAKTSTDIYDYATKIYKSSYVKDYDLIVITISNTDSAQKQIINDFRYYCEAINGRMDDYTKPAYEGVIADGNKFRLSDDSQDDQRYYDICYNKETELPIFSVRNTNHSILQFGCDQSAGNQKLYESNFLLPTKCLMSIRTEDYYNK